MRPIVKVYVRWDIGKRPPNRLLPNLNQLTLCNIAGERAAVFCLLDTATCEIRLFFRHNNNNNNKKSAGRRSLCRRPSCASGTSYISRGRTRNKKSRISFRTNSYQKRPADDASVKCTRYLVRQYGPSDRLLPAG